MEVVIIIRKQKKLENYKAEVCQTCANHDNNPSRCNKLKKFVQRKDTCIEGNQAHNYKWNGLFLQRSVEVK